MFLRQLPQIRRLHIFACRVQVCNGLASRESGTPGHFVGPEIRSYLINGHGRPVVPDGHGSTHVIAQSHPGRGAADPSGH